MRLPYLLPAAALAAGLAAIAACADAPTAVPASSAPATPALSIQPLKGEAGDTTVLTFTVQPGGGSFQLSPASKISFAKNAICDMATAGYGPGTWDAPCAATKSAVTVTARSYTTAAGHTRVDFAPALRFVPAPKAAVTLWLKDASAAQPGARVLWCADGAAACVDEASTDAALASKFDAKQGALVRPLKHFSGYSVGLGRELAY